MVTINSGTIAQAGECAAVSRIARRQSLSYLPDLHTAEEDATYFTTRVFATDTVFVALNEQSAVVGFISFGGGWVNHLYVLPAYQGAGTGGLLLEKAQHESHALELWTFERNERARRFYERRGFSVVRRTDGSENEEKEPDILLRWER